MKIITKANKGCGKLSSNETFFSDSWFSGLKQVEEANVEGVDLFWACEGIFPGYDGKVNERVVGRVSYCYEDYPKSSW